MPATDLCLTVQLAEAQHKPQAAYHVSSEKQAYEMHLGKD
jgi:hypothetical protein